MALSGFPDVPSTSCPKRLFVEPVKQKKIKRALRWQPSPLPSTLQKIFLVQAINSMGLAEAVRRLSRLAESLSRKSCQFDINMISFTNCYRGLFLSRFFIDFGN